MKREKWLLSLAKVAATRSTCPRLSVGAVLATDDSIIAVTFNGAPAGVEHCLESGCVMVGNHCITATHAEINAIAGCARYGTPTMGTILVVTHAPCPACAKAISRAGIEKVYYEEEYGSLGLGILTDAGIKVYKLL